MSKRTKSVYQNTSEIAELWAKQSQASARCKNAAFDGKSICSYGVHYLLGRLLTFNGRPIAAINFSRYSRTTTGQSYAASCAAEKAGHIVIYFKVDDSLSHHCRYDATDEEVRTHILATLTASQNYYLEQLELLAYETPSVCGVEMLSHGLKEFNKEANALLLEHLVIDVPDYYISEALKIARLKDKVKKDHSARKQKLFNFPQGYATPINSILRDPSYKESRMLAKRVS